MSDRHFMKLALEQARKSFAKGGVPVGSVLVRDGKVIGSGHNQRVQRHDPIAHGEMDAIRKASRQTTYRDTTLYTTLSPCMMCSGTIVQFGIPRVVIGENQTFGGNEEFLRERGVDVVVLDDPSCWALMDKFVHDYASIWFEDIGQPDVIHCQEPAHECGREKALDRFVSEGIRKRHELPA